MIAEVIAIGDEITTGQRLDTNSQWLSEQLTALGMDVLYHATVGDDLEANIRVFREAIDRSDIIISTGGLGPTADDLTRQSLADAMGVELEMDDAALQHIVQMFERRGRTMPERNQAQALFPAGTKMVHNPQGTAPGIFAEIPRQGRPPARVVCLPGVPAEMIEMWHDSVMQLIVTGHQAKRVLRHRRIKCFGVGESHLEEMLPDLIARGREPRVGITVSKATITLRITAAGETPEAALAAMDDTVSTIHQTLGDLVFGEEEDELEHAVLKLLAEQNKTLATIEIGTCGTIARSLATADNDGRFLGGQVINSSASLASWTPTAAALNEPFPEDPQDPQFIRSLAAAGRALSGADIVLAVGPFPENASTGDPPKINYALAYEGQTEVHRNNFGAHSAILLPLYSKRGMDLVRKLLIRMGRDE